MKTLKIHLATYGSKIIVFKFDDGKGLMNLYMKHKAKKTIFNVKAFMNYNNSRFLLNKRPKGMPENDCWTLSIQK